MYLNCPGCGLSIRRSHAPALAESCPRCLGKVGRRIPLFTTARPLRRHVAGHDTSAYTLGRPHADAA